ncbi:MAG: DUF4112 domain-containing protein [Hyphomicrobiaceae bacterium]
MTTNTDQTTGTGGFSDVFDHEHEDIKQLARIMDNQFAIPGTNIRFGFDALIGLVPVAGDLAGGAISLYLVAKALRHGAPMSLVARMLANTGIDMAAGSIPVVGDLFDVAWQANRMNVNLVDEHLRKVAAEKRNTRSV